MKKTERNLKVFLEYRRNVGKAYLSTTYKGDQTLLLARVMFEFTLSLFGMLADDIVFRLNLERKFKIGSDDCGNAIYFFLVADLLTTGNLVSVPRCFEEKNVFHLQINPEEGKWRIMTEDEFNVAEKKRLEERSARRRGEANFEISASAHIG